MSDHGDDDDATLRHKLPSQIPKIDPVLSRSSQNYSTWRDMIVLNMRLHLVWDVVSLKVPNPVIPTLIPDRNVMVRVPQAAGARRGNAPVELTEGVLPGNAEEVRQAEQDSAEWQRLNNFAKLLILNNIDKDVRSLLPTGEQHTASDLWTILANHFAPKSRGDAAATLRHLTHYDATPDMDFTLWTADMAGIYTKLRDQGCMLDDNTFTAIILNNLPKTTEWQTFYRIHSEVASSTRLFELINSEYERLSADDPTKLAAIFVAKHKAQKRRNAANATTTAAQTDGERTEKAKETVFCENCNRVGHATVDCRSKKRKRPLTRSQAKSAEASTSTANIRDHDVPASIVCFSEVAKAFASHSKSNIWIHDSASTEHIVHDKSLFTTYRSIAPIDVEGFNKTMVARAIGRGDVFVIAKYKGHETKLKLTNVLHMPEARNNLVSGVQMAKTGVTSSLNSRGPRLSSDAAKQYFCGGTLNTFFELDFEVIIPTKRETVEAHSSVPASTVPSVNATALSEAFGTAGWVI